MSTYYGAKIITENLALYLDANSLKSYPENGNIWYDLSKNNRDAIIFNSPTFFSSGIKWFSLNGSNQYMNVHNYTGIDFNISTVIYTARLNTSPNSRNTIFSKYDGTGPQFEWSSAGSIRSNYRQASAGTPENDAPNGGNQILSDVIYQIAVTYHSGTIAHYKNGIYLGANTNATQTNVNNLTNIGIGYNTSAGLYFKGDIFNLMIYNKVLSNLEILQNFNSMREKYRL